jgi:hypothetical protein
MAPLLAEHVVAVPLSVAVPVKQGQSLAVDLDMPGAKFNTNGAMIGPLIQPHPPIVAPEKIGKNGG